MNRHILKIFLLVIIVFSILQVASASTPNNQVTQLFEDELINGENEIGELLIIPIDYNTEYINHSNFSTFTTKRFDTLRWQGSESIEITAPSSQTTIIVPNGLYQFTSLGVYQVQSITNASNSFSIIIINEPSNLVDIFVNSIPNGMTMNFSDDSFILVDEEVIDVTLTIDEDLEPDDYQINYSVGNVNKTFNFELLKNYAWEVEDVDFDVNQSIKAGESRYVGSVTINNLGNQDVDISFTTSGNNSQIVSSQDEKTLFVGSSVEFDIQLQVPSITKPGDYDIFVSFKDDYDNVEEGNLTVSVIDSTLPSIDNITFSSTKAFTKNNIVVLANDNNDVTNVTFEVDDKVIQMKKDANRFTTTYTFDKISQYALTFCAYDGSNNKVCTQELKRFTKTNAITLVPSIKMPTVKYATYSKMKLFTLKEALSQALVVELLNIESAVPGDTSSQVRIVEPSGSIKRFDTYENAIDVKAKGTYYLEVRSDEIRDYQGIIRLNVPEYVEEVQDISFSVGFKDYEVPTNYAINDIYGTNTNCTPHDTGNFDTSYQLCPIKIPFNVKMEDIVIPMTVAEKERLHNEAQVIQDDFDKSKRRTATIITLLTTMVLLLVYGIYYMIAIFPYMRVKVRVKDED